MIQAGESEAAADYEAADSVQAFDAADLAALGAQTVEDLASFTPNLEIVTSGATTPTFFIRGVGLNDFNANSTGAVALYTDDVPINSPALQLGTLFDMEQVNVLRGPQGTGQARNASAGAIKLYSKKPSGEYGSFLSSSFGNYDYMDFEGAIEGPMYEDLLSSRFAFRWAEREGFGRNRCAGAGNDQSGLTNSYCGENELVENVIRDGLPYKVNDLQNWAARGTLRFEPTLDMEWLLGVHGGRRNELSRLGQAIGTRGFTCVGNVGCDQGSPLAPAGPRIEGVLGGQDTGNYTDPDIIAMLNEIRVPLLQNCNATFPAGAARQNCRRSVESAAKSRIAHQLAEDPLDDEPYHGDYDRVGPTKNDVWGGYLRGDIALPFDMTLVTVSGYDDYDRFIDIDLDFSPNKLFEIQTKDEGWQFTQSLTLSGNISDDVPVTWDIGGYYLMEDLLVHIENDFGNATFAAVAARDYTQKLWSTAGFASFNWDFWQDFTLDGGVRYNWERKQIDYELFRSVAGVGTPLKDFQEATWQAPTGTLRLTYRFREDTHAFLKYTRGWKGGHYNATSSLIEGVTSAEPETIDAFETGVRGAWFEGRLGLDLSLFYYSYKDYQLFTVKNDFGSLPEFIVLNASDAEVYGAEIDLQGRPFPGTFLDVRFGWLESQFLDFVQEQIVDLGNNVIIRKDLNFTGNRLLNSPPFKLSFTAEQTIPLGRFGSMTARYDGAWTADTYFDATEGRGLPNDQGIIYLPDNTIGQPAYWLHNLWLSYRPPVGNIEIAGWVRNLTDKVYKTYAFDASTFNQTTIHFTGTPRTYGMTFRVEF